MRTSRSRHDDGRCTPRRVVVTAIALVTGTVLLTGPAPAGAATPSTTTRTTTFTTNCSGAVIPLIIDPFSVERMGFEVTAPTGVITGEELLVRIAPTQRSFRDPEPSIVGPTSINSLRDIQVMYELPTNAEVGDVTVVAGSGHGLEGTPTVEVDTDPTPHRIVLHVPEVPKNPVGPSNETFFTLPAIDIELTATGAPGTNIETQLAGTDFATAGYVADADVTLAGIRVVTEHRCWPVGQVAAPIMSRTAILASGTTAASAPTEVTAEGGPGQATIAWEPPASDGGTPVTGYTVSVSPGGAVRRAGAEITRIDVAGLQPGTAYTFTVTAQNLLGSSPGVTTDEVVVQQPTTAFTDVSDDHVFSGEITWLSEAGITRGFPNDLFEPERPVTRQTMAAFLYRLSGEPSGENPVCSSAPFTDVAADDAFCGEITWLADSGIASGFPDGSFNPTQPVSRQTASAFLYRMADSPNGPHPICGAEPFTDVMADHPFCGEITWLADSGIASGFPDGSFNPTQPVSRQTASAFLYRLTLVTPGLI